MGWNVYTTPDFRKVSTLLNDNDIGASVTISLDTHDQWTAWSNQEDIKKNYWWMRFKGDANADIVANRLNEANILANSAIVCEFSGTWYIWCYVPTNYSGKYSLPQGT